MPKPSEDSLIPETKWLNTEDFEYLCFNFARQFLTYDEPIPEYSTRNNNMLESSLGAPRQTFGGKLLYPTLIKQASILFYSLIKNHPFENGNKRIAVISLLVFLSLNEKWLDIQPLDLYIIATFISESKPNERIRILKRIESTIRAFLVDFKK